MSPIADQACLRCRRQKRKCDKLIPTCSLCKRLNKPCRHPVQAERPRLVPVPDLTDLTESNLRYTLEVKVSSIVGDGLQLREAAATYFRTVHTWLPAVSETGYYTRLSRYQVQATPSDFSILTLCMFLVCVKPEDGEMSLQMRGLYTSIKGLLAMLEAMGTNSLEMLQGRLLLTVFEIGHALYPSAYISAAANVRAALALEANATSSTDIRKVFPKEQAAEEVRQTWRGIVITDRYASLESGNGPSASLEQTIDAVWRNSDYKDFARMEPFPKMTYSSQLLFQVQTHLYETESSQPLLNRLKAMDILNTLTSTLESFHGESPTMQTLSNSSLAICRSAMLEILEFGSHIQGKENEHCVQASVNILASLTHEIVHGASHVVTVSEALPTLPVFIPHCIYKAAIIYLQDPRVSKGVGPKLLIQPLKDLLRYIGMRWASARYYVDKIERAEKNMNLSIDV